MKYVVFTIAALGVFPLAFVLFIYRRLVKYVVWAMFGALCLYIPTSINFFSEENYRGSARGMEVSVLHLLSLALLLSLAMRGRLGKLLPEMGFFLYVGYFLLCLPSFSTAADGLIAWYETWKMIMLFVVYLAIYKYQDVCDGFRSTIAALAMFTILNALSVVKQHFGGVYQAHGFFNHQNSLAMAMTMLAPIFFSVYLQDGLRSGFSRLCAFAFLCAVGATVWTYSRGGLAMIPIGSGIPAAVALLKRESRLRTIKRLAPIAFAGVIGVAAVLPRVVQRFQEAPEESGNTRIELANCAIEMIEDEPICGVGINNWGIKINAPYEYAERAGRRPNRGEDFKDGVVETVYLLVCAECGIPALVAMLCWFGWHWLSCIRLLGRLKGTSIACIPAGILGGLTVNFMQSALEWVLRQQMNLILLMTVFAIVSYLNRNAHAFRASASVAAGKPRTKEIDGNG